MTDEPNPYSLDDVRARLRIGEMPPERYVALHAHKWMVAGPLAHIYSDPEVEAHVRRVEQLLRERGNLDSLRREWQSAEEYERVQAEISRMRDPDYEY